MRLYLGLAEVYDVAEAATGEEALERIAVFRPDLVLMDIRMPGIGGIEACRRLKLTPSTCMIPVVFVSAWNADNDQESALRAGGKGFVSKPFSLKQLLQTVAQFT